eukprot:COSAG01_NODE_54824_length_329_cov_0.978261_1_plen_71_part_10
MGNGEGEKALSSPPSSLEARAQLLNPDGTVRGKSLMEIKREMVEQEEADEQRAEAARRESKKRKREKQKKK